MKKIIKIVFVVNSLEIGGMEKMVVTLAKYLNRNKFYPIVYCLEKKGEFAYELEENNIELRLVKNKRFLTAFILARVFKNDQVDIVHSQSGVYRDATLGARLAKIPIIIHTDHGKFYPDSKWTRFNHWLFSHFRDKVICVCDELMDFMKERVGLNHKKVIRIYNGIEVEKYKRGVDILHKKKKLGIEPHRKIVGVIARLVPVKNHLMLLHALKIVKRYFDDVLLLIIGDGPLLKKLKEEVGRLHLERNVIFLGKRKDVEELLFLIDVVCLPSQAEGLSVTLMEAMASGRAVVATEVGGNSELIINGRNGFLIPPSNAKVMAERIVSLLENEALRRRIGEEAKRRINEIFNVSMMVKNYEKLYCALAKQKGILKN